MPNTSSFVNPRLVIHISKVFALQLVFYLASGSIIVTRRKIGDVFQKKQNYPVCAAIQGGAINKGRSYCRCKSTAPTFFTDPGPSCMNEFSTVCPLTIASADPIAVVDLSSASAPSRIGVLTAPSNIHIVCKDITSLAYVEYWDDPIWRDIGTTYFTIQNAGELVWKTSQPHQLKVKFEGLLLKVVVDCQGTGFASQQCALIKVLGKRKHPFDITTVTIPSVSASPTKDASSTPTSRITTTSFSATTIVSSSLVVEQTSSVTPTQSSSRTPTPVVSPVRSTSSVTVFQRTSIFLQPTSSVVEKPKDVSSSIPVQISPQPTSNVQPPPKVSSSKKISATSQVPVSPTPAGPNGQPISDTESSKTLIIGVSTAVVGAILIVVCVIGFYLRKRSQRPTYMMNMRSPKNSPRKKSLNTYGLETPKIQGGKIRTGVDNKGYDGPVPLKTIGSEGRFNSSNMNGTIMKAGNGPFYDQPYERYDMVADNNGPWNAPLPPLPNEPETLYQEIGLYEQPVDSGGAPIIQQPQQSKGADEPNPGSGYSSYNQGDDLYQTLDDTKVETKPESGKTYEPIDRSTLRRRSKPMAELLYDEPEGTDHSPTAAPHYDELENDNMYSDANDSIYHQIGNVGY